MKITKEKYDEVTTKLRSKLKYRECRYCGSENSKGAFIYPRFVPYEKSDEMLKFRCPVCGLTEFFDPEVEPTFE